MINEINEENIQSPNFIIKYENSAISYIFKDKLIVDYGTAETSSILKHNKVSNSIITKSENLKIDNTFSNICKKLDLKDISSKNNAEIPKKKKRVRFKNKFLNIVEVESYKYYNSMMYFSEVDRVNDNYIRKCKCSNLCLIY